jgi:hypothetical protein
VAAAAMMRATTDAPGKESRGPRDSTRSF